MKRLIIPGLIMFLVILLVTFPARVAYQWFPPPELQLSGIAGSVWNGTAAEAVAGGAHVRDIAWKFKPASLLAGELGFATSSRPLSGTINTDVTVSPDGTLTLSALSGSVALEHVHPVFEQSGIRGNILLQFETLVIRNGKPVETVGSATVRDFFVRDLSSSPIGDFRADFQTSAGVITATVTDVAGVLDVEGSITLNPDGSYAFIGQVAPTPETPRSITNQLRFLGSPNRRGQHEFRFEGQL